MNRYVINEQAGTDQTNQVSDGVLFRTTAGSQDLSVTFYSFDGSLPPALGDLTPYNDGQNGHPGPGIDADSFQVVPYPLGVNAGFRLEYQSDVGAPEPAPEPATVTLFTFGLFVVVLYRFGRLKSAPVAGASGSTWCWFAGSRGCTTRSRC